MPHWAMAPSEPTCDVSWTGSEFRPGGRPRRKRGVRCSFKVRAASLDKGLPVSRSTAQHRFSGEDSVAGNRVGRLTVIVHRHRVLNAILLDACIEGDVRKRDPSGIDVGLQP